MQNLILMRTRRLWMCQARHVHAHEVSQESSTPRHIYTDTHIHTHILWQVIDSGLLRVPVYYALTWIFIRTMHRHRHSHTHIHMLWQVVDSGKLRVPVYHAFTGISDLVNVDAPRSIATLRASSAGRNGPGLCVRCVACVQDISVVYARDFAR
jgi:hypothetical protein